MPEYKHWTIKRLSADGREVEGKSFYYGNDEAQAREEFDNAPDLRVLSIALYNPEGEIVASRAAPNGAARIPVLESCRCCPFSKVRCSERDAGGSQRGTPWYATSVECRHTRAPEENTVLSEDYTFYPTDLDELAIPEWCPLPSFG